MFPDWERRANEYLLEFNFWRRPLIVEARHRIRFHNHVLPKLLDCSLLLLLEVLTLNFARTQLNLTKFMLKKWEGIHIACGDYVPLSLLHTGFSLPPERDVFPPISRRTKEQNTHSRKILLEEKPLKILRRNLHFQLEIYLLPLLCTFTGSKCGSRAHSYPWSDWFNCSHRCCSTIHSKGTKSNEQNEVTNILWGDCWTSRTSLQSKDTKKQWRCYLLHQHVSAEASLNSSVTLAKR